MIPDLDCAVLLPIDIQRGFDDPRWPRRWNPDFEANALALLGGWRAIGSSIIHVRHDSVEPGSSLAPGQPGNDFRSGFQQFAEAPGMSNSVNSALLGHDRDVRHRLRGTGKGA